MSPVRLSDVAALAGVSPMTVSNVVNRHPHVRPGTRDRVLAAIDQLGYRPNASARRLATGRTRTLAIALPEIDVPYFAELARALADVALARSYRVVIEQTIVGADAERAVLAEREQGLVDGVVFHPTTPTADALTEAAPHVPVVLLGEGRAPEGVDRVMIDNVAAAQEAVRHLVAAGRTRIAFLGCEPERMSETTRLRIAGYDDALRSSGLGTDPELVLHTAWYHAEDGERSVSEALHRGIEFDALLCRDDVLASGALRALHLAGLDVPGDVAVVGWDAITAASFLRPTLTTVSPDKTALASTAIDLLIERIDGYAGPGRHRVAPHRLVRRESG